LFKQGIFPHNKLLKHNSTLIPKKSDCIGNGETANWQLTKEKMMSEITQNQLDGLSSDLGSALQAVLEENGLSGYEIENIELKPKATVETKGLLPGCELKCKVSGFPPKVKCSVECS